MDRHFHSLTTAWFAAKVGAPTDIQRQAWPRIAAGEHVLAVAPTGSGKTLTAFLSALDSLATGKWPTGRISVVYVTPLKALGNDVRRNLVMPLAGLRRAFEEAGAPFPAIRAAIRTGDTPADERRRMVRHPPEILLTTPESLNLLLSSQGGRSMLGAVRLVILDEIHAVAGSKRGAFLLGAVERLALVAGEFQRVALSATVAPLSTVAAMVGGFVPQGDPNDPVLTPRPVAVVTGGDTKAMDIRVRRVAWPDPDDPKLPQMTMVAREVRRRILANRTTLVFVNSRKLCEKLARLINDDPDGPGDILAQAHHGSLSKELRVAVETRLKAGELRAVVATQSLELGIDIGDVTEVLLVECPPTVSAALQRLGRSGHGVGLVSRGLFLPTSDKDLLEAAVMARAVAERDIEPVRPVEAPLDVLAQMLVAMLGVEAWDVDALFTAVRRAWPYRALSRPAFDLTLAMLAGRYADTRLRELAPLVAVDGLTGQATARPGALMRLYASGGVIADRGYFALRRQDSGTRLGELDEVFVWEARLGQIFAFGAQNWRIERITDADVYASPAPDGVVPAPFWIGEARSRDRHFSRLLAAFLETAEERLTDPAFRQTLVRNHFLEEDAAEALLDFLGRQQAATGTPLPHARHLLVELTATGPGGAPGTQIILHAPLGLGVTAPLGLILEAAASARLGQEVPVFAGNDCVALTLPEPVDPDVLLGSFQARDIPELLRARLEGSGSFGAAFREAAGRALLLPREGFGKRTPLWINRLRARKLLSAVAGHGDFPMVLEAWRTCLDDVFDLEGLRAFWADVKSGAVAVSVARTRTQSPFAADLVWRHITEYMYLTDAGTTAGPTGARPDLVAEVARSAARPGVPEAVARQFAAKRQRLHPGYAPSRPAEVLELVKERVLVTEAEWAALAAAVERDHGLTRPELEAALAPKLARIEARDGGAPRLAALERAGLVALALHGEAALASPWIAGAQAPRPPVLAPDEAAAARQALLVEWFSFFGPMSLTDLAGHLGLPLAVATRAAEDLLAADKWLSGDLVSGQPGPLCCDAGNFEMLLRLARAARRPGLAALPADRLPYFLARWQGLTNPATDAKSLAERLERLVCLPLPAGLWETEVLPARCRNYDPAWLDAALAATGLAWFGAGTKRICFAHPDDLDLAGFTVPDTTRALFPDPRARYDFTALLEVTGLGAAELTHRLWQALWRGEAACDALAVLRRGLATDFTPEPAFVPAPRQGHRVMRRTSPGRFAAALPSGGAWFRPRVPPVPSDALDQEALLLDRARLLLDRYGVLCRDILVREVPVLAWGGVFRALRRLELSGEVVAGEFFTGLSGPQFASPRAVRLLAGGMTGREAWWCAALDPVLAAGGGPGMALPRRVAGAYVAFLGPRPVLVAEAGAKRLELALPPDDPDLPAALAPLSHALTRRSTPAKRLAVATINGQSAGDSPYLPALRERFDVVRERRGLTLYPGRERA
jgi:ATP-dependent helicase Lhr and Lhr-like helicase